MIIILDVYTKKPEVLTSQGTV